MSHRTTWLRVLVLRLIRGIEIDRIETVTLARRLFIGCVYGLSLGLLAGCSNQAKEDVGPTGTVTGEVTLKGAPLTEGRLNFANVQGGAGSSGALTEGGKYTLDEPLPVGEYDVFISFEFSPEALKSGMSDVLKTIPKKYRSAKNSKLKASVKEGENKHDFSLK